MTKRLTEAQVAQYRRDGFYGPVGTFSQQEARQMRDSLEEFENGLVEKPVSRKHRRKLHVLLPWARNIVEDPRIVDAIEDIIGPDILVFTSTFFIKEPNSESFTAWHQDGTYFGLEPFEHVTAWVAFSNASREAGCMEFVRGSQKRGQVVHEIKMDAVHNLNNMGQHIPEAYDASQVALCPLEPGEFSLHHTHVIHSSAPNNSNDRRIGFGISYIPAHVFKRGTRASATLVRGRDHDGHFDLEPDPRTMSKDAAIAAHDAAYNRFRKNYQELQRQAAA